MRKQEKRVGEKSRNIAGGEREEEEEEKAERE